MPRPEEIEEEEDEDEGLEELDFSGKSDPDDDGIYGEYEAELDTNDEDAPKGDNF